MQISLLHDDVRVLQNQATAHGSPAAIEFFPVEVSFDAIKDPGERTYFMDMPTSFALSAEEIDRLRETGGRLLCKSPEFRRLLKQLGAKPG